MTDRAVGIIDGLMASALQGRDECKERGDKSSMHMMAFAWSYLSLAREMIARSDGECVDKENAK